MPACSHHRCRRRSTAAAPRPWTTQAPRPDPLPRPAMWLPRKVVVVAEPAVARPLPRAHAQATMIVLGINRATGDTVAISVLRNLEHMPMSPGPLRRRFPTGFDDLANAVHPFAMNHPNLGLDPAEAVKEAWPSSRWSVAIQPGKPSSDGRADLVLRVAHQDRFGAVLDVPGPPHAGPEATGLRPRSDRQHSCRIARRRIRHCTYLPP
ncbi:MAG TPA: hypothetical protein VKD67_02935 [Acidimicrobiales bacterium]|nr:hypothetical protein [Acidimicrobiales bacterium]